MSDIEPYAAECQDCDHRMLKFSLLSASSFSTIQNMDFSTKCNECGSEKTRHVESNYVKSERKISDFLMWKTDQFLALYPHSKKNKQGAERIVTELDGEPNKEIVKLIQLCVSAAQNSLTVPNGFLLNSMNKKYQTESSMLVEAFRGAHERKITEIINEVEVFFNKTDFDDLD